MVVRPKPVALPLIEQAVYWLVGVTCIAYSVYSVYGFSKDLKSSPDASCDYRTEGWESLGGVKDGADYEWHIYSSSVIWRTLPWMGLHVIVSLATRLFHITGKTKKILLLGCGAAAAWHFISWRYLCFTALTPVIFLWISTMRSVSAIWTVAVCGLVFMNNYSHMVDNMLQLEQEFESFIFVPQWFSVLARSIAFGLERVWSLKQQESSGKSPVQSSSSSPSSSSPSSSSSLRRNKSSKDKVQKDISLGPFIDSAQHTSSKSNENGGKIGTPSSSGTARTSSSALYEWPVLPKVPELLDGLLYVFYVPLLVSGPPMSLHKFLTEIKSPKKLTSDRVLDVAWCLLRVAFWFVFSQVALHFVFFASVANCTPVFPQMDRWTLFGTAILLGQFMTNKYFVIYGLPAQVAKLDGLDPPSFPACTLYIYKYSDMWKSFDRGLYEFLKRYVYVPCGGSRSGFDRQQAATLLTFAYMAIWHGGGKKHLCWAMLNFIEADMEITGAWLERSQFVQTHLLRKLSPHGVQRLRAALGVLALIVGTTSNMFFLGGTRFGVLYGSSFLSLDRPVLQTCAVFYCMTQICRQLERLGYTKF